MVYWFIISNTQVVKDAKGQICEALGIRAPGEMDEYTIFYIIEKGEVRSCAS